MFLVPGILTDIIDRQNWPEDGDLNWCRNDVQGMPYPFRASTATMQCANITDQCKHPPASDLNGDTAHDAIEQDRDAPDSVFANLHTTPFTSESSFLKG